MQSLTTFEQLAQKLQEAEQARAISDDAFRASLSEWYLSAELFAPPPSDVFSAAYRTYQLNLYKELTQQPYQVSNEAFDFDLECELRAPYPYGTQSAGTVGNHLMSYGWLIRKLNLPAGSRILEVGSGYGSLTIHLANMGYHVTCVDVNQQLLEMTAQRTAQSLVPAQTVCGDMATVTLSGEFDAIIFNASLHHSLDHARVIERLSELLTPTGILAFSAEPIAPPHTRHIPYPWGVRLDGISIYSIVKWGWLELGFQDDYFVALLNRLGWHLTRHNLYIVDGGDVWIATRADARKRASIGTRLFRGYDVDTELSVKGFRKFVEVFAPRFLIKLLQKSHIR